MPKMKNLSIVLDQDTLDRIRELQKELDIFSRSEVVRMLIIEALDNKQQVG